MKQLISALIVLFFLTTVVFTQAQDKQQVKKDVKVEKVEKKDACCSTEKSSKKEMKGCCDTEKSKSKAEAENDDCCKTGKSSTKSKESKE
jgi:hypothetical protein